MSELPAGFALEEIPDAVDAAGFRLVLRALAEPRMTPIAVDFRDAAVLHRLRGGVGRGELLAKALGIKSRAHAPYVFDATAGMGTDAFFIAALGCRVRAVERSPAIARLLADGHRRLARNTRADATPLATSSAPSVEDTLAGIAARLHFEYADAREVLTSIAQGGANAPERPDVVYLDPMYPHEGRSDSALPKKAMQIFRRLIGDDVDAAELFAIALTTARLRVVVKRPTTLRRSRKACVGPHIPSWVRPRVSICI